MLYAKYILIKKKTVTKIKWISIMMMEEDRVIAGWQRRHLGAYEDFIVILKCENLI